MFGSKKKKKLKAKPAPASIVVAPAEDDFFEFEGANIAPKDATLGAKVQKSTGRKSGIVEGRVTKFTVNKEDGTTTFETNIVPPGFPGRGASDPDAMRRRHGIHRAENPTPDTLIDKVANVFTRKKKKVSGVIVEGAKSAKVVGKPKESDYQRCLAAEIGDMEDDDLGILDL